MPSPPAGVLGGLMIPGEKNEGEREPFRWKGAPTSRTSGPCKQGPSGREVEGSAPGIRKRANGFALSEYRAPRHSLKIAFEEAGSKGDLSILKTLNGGAVQAKLKLGCHTSSILQSFVRNAPLASVPSNAISRLTPFFSL